MMAKNGRHTRLQSRIFVLTYSNNIASFVGLKSQEIISIHCNGG